MAETDDDLIVCRCEEITVKEIKNAIAIGAKNVDAIKRITRAGMGLCQNKTCYNLIIRIINKETGIPLSELENFTTRPPVRPISVRSWSK